MKDIFANNDKTAVMIYKDNTIYGLTPDTLYDTDTKRWHGFMNAIVATGSTYDHALTMHEIDTHLWCRQLKTNTEYDLNDIVHKILVARNADLA